MSNINHIFIINIVDPKQHHHQYLRGTQGSVQEASDTDRVQSSSGFHRSRKRGAGITYTCRGLCHETKELKTGEAKNLSFGRPTKNSNSAKGDLKNFVSLLPDISCSKDVLKNAKRKSRKGFKFTYQRYRDYVIDEIDFLRSTDQNSVNKILRDINILAELFPVPYLH